MSAAVINVVIVGPKGECTELWLKIINKQMQKWHLKNVKQYHFLKFIFSWRIIAQCCVGFYSSLYISPPSWASLPPLSSSQSTELSSRVTQKLPTSSFTHAVCMSALLSVHPTLSSPVVSTSPFSRSASLFPPCT